MPDLKETLRLAKEAQAKKEQNNSSRPRPIVSRGVRPDSPGNYNATNQDKGPVSLNEQKYSSIDSKDLGTSSYGHAKKNPVKGILEETAVSTSESSEKNNEANTTQSHNKFITNTLPNTIQIHNENTTYPEQSHDKLTTNTHQIHNKSTTNPLLDNQPIPDKHITNTQLSHIKRIPNTESTRDKLITNSILNTKQNSQQNTLQTHDKRVVLKHDFSSVPFSLQVTGIKKRFLLYLFQICHRIGSRTSSPIRISNAAKVCECSVKTLETIINRLRKDSYILKGYSRIGKEGWAQHILPEEVYQGILRDLESGALSLENPNIHPTKHPTNSLPTHNHHPTEHPTQHLTQHPTTLSSSSSDINNKNITNTIGPESKRQDLTEDWLQIQTPENVKAIGFGQTQIKQLFQLGTLSAPEVQESLEAFAYDLDVGGISSRGSKLAFLMGILRRSGAYISEGLVNELKVQVENNEKRRREMADLEKRQAQDKLTAKAQEIASHMTEREKLSLVPENGLVKMGSVSHERLVMAKIVEGLSKS
jgi:hypothetical protein